MEPWIIGMDISTLLEVEICGGKYYNNKVEGDAIEILRSYGANMVRLRLWNDPFDEEGNSYGAGTCDLKTVLTLARRAKAAGMDWLLDFHYSDFWADPGKQYPPKAWAGYDLAEMKEAVYDYTLSVIEECARKGLMPGMIAIGNELSNGMLWPLGKLPEYKNLAELISAGIRAARKAAAGVPVMIHLDNGGNNELYRRWFDNYLSNGGEDFDCIGLSYYPFWHGSLEDLRGNMADVSERYGKPLYIAEVSMGFTMEDYAAYEGLAADERNGYATRQEVAAKVPYPMTKEGQTAFMEDFIKTIRSVKGCRGYFYWEPAWLPRPGSGWATPAAIKYMNEKGKPGNEWANQALFDYDGNALPALKVLKN